MPDSTDISSCMAGGKQIQGIQLGHGEGGKKVQHVKEAGFIGLYPFKFTSDFTGDFGTDGRAAFVCRLYAGYNLLIGGVLQHIVAHTQLEGRKISSSSSYTVRMMILMSG